MIGGGCSRDPRQPEGIQDNWMKSLGVQAILDKHIATGEAFREKRWDSMDGMRDVSHSLLPGKRNQKWKKWKGK
ncbi:hypothetical protein NQZ68_039280 [Dissostichus eleginoides]|nr:hypothetical protein NQZ68_039280 [Dissostichus eleginoides]